MRPLHRSADSSSDRAPRQANLTRLSGAVYAGKRLAALRRLLGVPLVLTGALGIAVGCWRGNFLLARATLVLALPWLALLMPVLRVLYLEWRNDRLIANLHARIHLADDSDSLQ